MAASLKHLVGTSRPKRTGAYRSALSMLTFYINRAGSNPSAVRRRLLLRAKEELAQAIRARLIAACDRGSLSRRVPE